MMYAAFYLMSNAFRTYVIYKFMSIFFEKEGVNHGLEIFLYVCFFGGMSAIYLKWDIPALNMLGNIVGLLFMTKVYKESLTKRILSVFYVYFLLIASESFVVVLFGYMPFNVLDRGLYKSIFGIICVPIIPYIVVLLLQNRKNLQKSIQVPIVYWIATIVVPSISIYLIACLFSSRQLSDRDMFIEVGLLLFLNIIVFSLYEKQNINFEKIRQNEFLDVQNKYYSNQIELMQRLSEQTKSLRHDLKNHLLGIQGYVKDKKYSELETYLQKSIDVGNLMTSYANTGNTLVDSLLNYKLQEAEKIGVKVDIDLQVASQIELEGFNLTVVLGNLLDNALTALQQCKEERKLAIEMQQGKGYLRIHIQNTFSGSVKCRNGKFITSKSDKENHGIGLSNVEKMVRKYGGTMCCEVQNHCFDVMILLYTV